MNHTNQHMELGTYKDLKDFLSNQDSWMSKVQFTENEKFKQVKIKTPLNNESNQISMTIEKLDSDFNYVVETVLAGLTSYRDFFDLLEYANDNHLVLISKEEPWFTKEVLEGLLKVKDRIQSNRITKGMQVASKPLGRPSNEEQINIAVKLYRTGDYTVSQIVQITGVSKSTLYRHL